MEARTKNYFLFLVGLSICIMIMLMIIFLQMPMSKRLKTLKIIKISNSLLQGLRTGPKDRPKDRAFPELLEAVYNKCQDVDTDSAKQQFLDSSGDSGVKSSTSVKME